MIVKPYISFLNFDSDGQLIIDVSAIIAAMTGNKNYPTPSPALAAIATSLSDFTTAVSNAVGGGVTLTAIKNAKRAALVSLIRALALYVQGACNGDLAMLKSSGFPTQKPQRQPIGELPAPANLTVALGTYSGQLDASVTPVPGAFTYNWQVLEVTAPSVVVQSAQTTASSNTFTGLTPGKVYLAQASVVGTAGPSDWTTSASQMVV